VDKFEILEGMNSGVVITHGVVSQDVALYFPRAKTLKCYNNITIRIEKEQYALDFLRGIILMPIKYGIPWGHSFILDYRKRKLVILPSEVL
jgi:hypothetical protein